MGWLRYCYDAHTGASGSATVMIELMSYQSVDELAKACD